MSNGANSIHIRLRTELENYIRSQYFGKTPILLSAIDAHIDEEGLLYQKPFIESSSAYKSIPDGINSSNLDDWLKQYFSNLAEAGVGVHSSPFTHQIKALEAAVDGQDLFVATGTGSGKTECFMWPILAKMAMEARDSEKTWQMRGARTIIMYPMNALVSDQVSRLRKLIGDRENRFINIFRDSCGSDRRRPQFGMYTGRTPYAGAEPKTSEDRDLEKTLARMSFPKNDKERNYFESLNNEGKIPAKADMRKFLENLHEDIHLPDPEDAELITRFEMQAVCPDILITNYSMLEYMLIRPREKKIWDETKKWLNENENNKLLFVIDEAHMYRGSSGGEVALLIRRLFHRLGISRDRVQFILTTASMPNKTEEDRQSVRQFANKLTANDNGLEFCYLTGEKEEMAGKQEYDIPFSNLCNANITNLEESDNNRLLELNIFWNNVDGVVKEFSDLNDAYEWMYGNLIKYRPFNQLFEQCRGNAVSLQELADCIFQGEDKTEALKAVSVMLAIAPLAHNHSNAVLFPARMHMLFRGIKGVYACTNKNCSCSHSDGTLTLGEIFLSDGKLVCPHCQSAVYELYNDRRCGALFYKGYIFEDEADLNGISYLWHYPGQIIEKRMKEIHLFIPSDDYQAPTRQGTHPIRPCYLDVRSGFINFRDDSLNGKEGIRKLYYCKYSTKGRPQVITFPTCPHCHHQLHQAQLTSFSTRGNQSFYNLIKSQFEAEPAVIGKDNDPERLPNQGRKVLLFSDSRLRAAKLARDMSEASEIAAARQLFVLAISMMEKSTEDRSMNDLYDYFCLVSGQKHVQMFHGEERQKFIEDSKIAKESYERAQKRKRDYKPRFSIDNAPIQLQEFMLKLFSGGYNTLYDSASCWIEPTDEALFDSVDMLDEKGIDISKDEFIEIFNAWMLYICDSYTALGHTISDDVRLNVRARYGYEAYGLDKEWKFNKVINEIMKWEEGSQKAELFNEILGINFLTDAQPVNGRKYVDLGRIKPRYQSEHTWYRCRQCSEITPYPLKGKCPSCGSDNISIMTDDEYDSLVFWRKPVQEALTGNKIQVIDTEEHTAQLSHKDQRNNLWSKTEQYELRFQDLLQDDEAPVDILSSTTTMEVGIDIGSLVAVGLRNIPPMRENYQQRAGRAGRRGASLSTIVTFCEDGPHDTLYFNNPAPMFRGDPRRPWLDTESDKLLQRHMSIVILEEYLADKQLSLDDVAAADFLDNHLDDFVNYLSEYRIFDGDLLLPANIKFDWDKFYNQLIASLRIIKEKKDKHPELYGMGQDSDLQNVKSMLDALYEEGIIPTYSFPKNVVSAYIMDNKGKTKYEVERGLDVAIGEYAPGRAIVVDKETYQIGGLYYPGSDRKKGKLSTNPAKSFIEDPNYLKVVVECSECGWFGLQEENNSGKCPFCGNTELSYAREMLRPWGFAPRNAEAISDAQLDEEYSYVQQPLYSTLPDADEMSPVKSSKHIRIASRSNQRIIMVNNGDNNTGFMVCKDCGAAVPGEDPNQLDPNLIQRPYKNQMIHSKCRHSDCINVNLGYDFVTDMLVLEFSLDENVINTNRKDNPWLPRAAQSLAEALRLAASKELDVEFTELVTGYRLRRNMQGSFVDLYLYDSLSSGAGYAVAVANQIEILLKGIFNLLNNCDCENACHKCLKHYRNQNIHGMLDRFAALELLNWGIHGEVAPLFSVEKQAECIKSLEYILSREGYEVCIGQDTITVNHSKKSKRLVIYPAMRAEPQEAGTIYISDAYFKYAKPFALKKITDSF